MSNYHFNSAIESVKKAEEESNKEIARLKELLDVGTLNLKFHDLRLSTMRVEYKKRDSYYLRSEDIVTVSVSWGGSYGDSPYKSLGRSFPFSQEGLNAFSAFLKEIEVLDRTLIEENKKINSANRAVLSKVKEIIVSAGFPKEEYRYKTARSSKREKFYTSWYMSLAVPSMGAESQTVSIQSLEEAFKRTLNEQEKKKLEEKQKKEAEILSNPLTQEAVTYLQGQGKVLGTDFTLLTAIGEANNLAYELEVKKLIATGGVDSFDGQNCEGPCAGWDGTSHRCDCGNRRMNWTTGMGHSFKTPYVHAEAY